MSRTDAAAGDDPGPSRPTWRFVLGRWALAAVAVAVLGLALGWLASRSQPRLAAGALVADFVVREPATVDLADASGAGPADPDAVAPSSGGFSGQPRCGVADSAVDNDAHLATLAAGGIVVRHRVGSSDDPQDLAQQLADWADGRAWVLVAPEPRLDVPVVALAWERRMELASFQPSLLTAFVTAEVGVAEPPAGCSGKPD